MRNCTRRRSLLVVCLITVFARHASAFQTGITGLTTDSVTGCNQCHSGGATPIVTLSGPQAVLPGSTTEYLLQIFEIGSQHRGGLDFGATAGTLAVGGSHSSFTQNAFGEITHTSPKPGDGTSVKFSFLWTAPNTLTTETLRGWGNAVNFSGTNSGDAASYTTLP
ncbi:MAG TPA: choice-of-anchor V domain-containing protein, partial [Candidatus Acidoferrales bacterium]|nr:choice-of-anchor V domain-containing protein [Candidatus Acidoferrales bacterium]